MKNKKILALALLSSLALVGCGEKNDLPSIDSSKVSDNVKPSSTISSSQSSSSSESSKDSTSSNDIISSGTKLEATVENKQAFYDTFRGALDKESKYRGNLYGKADGTVDGLITKVVMNGIQMDVSAIPEIAAQSNLNLEGHAQFEKDIANDDFNLDANYKSITGDFKESGFGKLSVYTKDNQRYIYSIDSNEYSGMEEQPKPNESIKLVEGDIVEHDIFTPIEMGIQEFLKVPEYKNFNVFEEAIKPQIEALKEQGYNINYDFELVKNVSLYNVKLTVNGKGSLVLKDPNNPNTSMPFDKLNNAQATVELSYTDSQIKSLKASAEIEVSVESETENGKMETFATIKGNGEAHLDHIVNDSFDVVENSNIPESKYGEMVSYDNFYLLNQNKTSENNNKYNQDFDIYFDNMNKLNQKIDLSSKLQPSSLKHSKVNVKDAKTKELLDINNYKVDSLSDAYEISYEIDDGYALVLSNVIFENNIKFDEIDLSKSNKYVIPLPEKINENLLDYIIKVDEHEYNLKDFYKFQPEDKSYILDKPLEVSLDNKEIHYVYMKPSK